MISLLYSAAEAVRSRNWFIVFKVPTLDKVTLFIQLLHLSKFGLGSVTDFLNPGARASNPCRMCVLFTREKGGAVEIRVIEVFRLFFSSSTDATLIDD